MNELKKLKVSIGGKVFLISTDEEESNLEQATKLLDSLLHSNLDLQTEESKKLVLVALQLAIDLTKSKKDLDLYKDGVKDLNNLLICQI